MDYSQQRVTFAVTVRAFFSSVSECVGEWAFRANVYVCVCHRSPSRASCPRASRFFLCPEYSLGFASFWAKNAKKKTLYFFLLWPKTQKEISGPKRCGIFIKKKGMGTISLANITYGTFVLNSVITKIILWNVSKYHENLSNFTVIWRFYLNPHQIDCFSWYFCSKLQQYYRLRFWWLFRTDVP